MRHSFYFARLVLSAAAVTATIAGCQRWNWRGEGYNDQTATWTKNLRPPADERGFTGLDARARDIERSLGVR